MFARIFKICLLALVLMIGGTACKSTKSSLTTQKPVENPHVVLSQPNP